MVVDPPRGEVLRECGEVLSSRSVSLLDSLDKSGTVVELINEGFFAKNVARFGGLDDDTDEAVLAAEILPTSWSSRRRNANDLPLIMNTLTLFRCCCTTDKSVCKFSARY